MSLLKRLASIVIAILYACFAGAVFNAVFLVLIGVPLSVTTGVFGLIEMWIIAFNITLFFAFLVMPLFIAIAEWNGIQGIKYHLLTWMCVPTLMFFFSTIPASDGMNFFALFLCGAACGFVYWRSAGHVSGRWREQAVLKKKN